MVTILGYNYCIVPTDKFRLEMSQIRLAKSRVCLFISPSALSQTYPTVYTFFDEANYPATSFYN